MWVEQAAADGRQSMRNWALCYGTGGLNMGGMG